MSDVVRRPSRVASGLLMAVGVVVVAFLGGWVWGLTTLFLFYPIAYKEMVQLMAAREIHPSKVVINLFAPAFYIFALLQLQRHFEILVTMGIIFSFGWLLLRKKRASISDIGGTIMMFFYLGFLPAHFILLRQLGVSPGEPFWQEEGLRYLFLVLFIVSASDVFAYYGGKRFGKNLLSPEISPKKTLEGALSGVVMATVVALIFGWLSHIPLIHAGIMGVLIAIVAQVGDLSESLIKRDAGFKDSGNLIPGHGGILDRTDSYIFAAAVAYYYIVWFVLHLGLAQDVMGWFQR